VPTYREAQLDAIGDRTRRTILARLRRGPLPVGELANDFTISRPAISQHLKVLEKAKLVVARPVGNRRYYELNPEGFSSMRDYFDEFWGVALISFKRRIEQSEDEK
jgi:DNA-binding transcriptional ArsR family regulator